MVHTFKKDSNGIIIKDINIFEKERILIPINLPDHFILVAICGLHEQGLFRGFPVFPGPAVYTPLEGIFVLDSMNRISPRYKKINTESKLDRLPITSAVGWMHSISSGGGGQKKQTDQCLAQRFLVIIPKYPIKVIQLIVTLYL